MTISEYPPFRVSVQAHWPGEIDSALFRTDSRGTQRLSRVNANVDVPLATADEQLRVSDAVKRELDRRRREGESYNDVLERLLDEERDQLAGFGRWSDEHAERVRAAREQSKRKSKDRMRRLENDGCRSSTRRFSSTT